MIRIDHPEWMSRAACAGAWDAFYPEAHEAVAQTREAKRICSVCPVRIDCLDYAFLNDERHGIWGGLDERERRMRERGMSQPDVDIDRVAVERCVHGLLTEPKTARHDYKQRLNPFEKSLALRILVHDHGWQRSTIGSALSVNTTAARRLHDAALEAGAVNLEREAAA